MNEVFDISTRMENDEIDIEVADEKLMLKLLKGTSYALHFMSDKLRKDIAFFRRAVKINGKAIICDVFDVCDKEIILELLKKRTVCEFLPKILR